MGQHRLRVGDRVVIKSEVASGPVTGRARVTHYEPAPPWLPDGTPVIWVRLEGWNHDLSVTPSEVERVDP
jgi:hypothetical protein